MKTKFWTLAGVVMMVAVLTLAACQPQTVIVEKEVTKVVTEEKIVKETVVVETEKEVTKVVTVKETVQVEVTPTPTAIPQGGFLNLTSFADADILSPLMSSDSASSEIEGYIFSSPFMTDPWTGETAPNMVESWDVTDGNKTVTFSVRQGMSWSDGEPITANDYKFMFDALMATDDEGNPALAESPRLDMVEYVETVELIDDYTLQVTYSEPICTNFESLSLAWLPSHVFLADPDFEFGDLAEHEFNWNPTVFSGPFMLTEWVKDDHVTVVRNPNYWKGAPYLDGIVWRVVANATVEKEMLKAGETDIAGIDPKYLTEMEQVEGLDIYKFFRTAYTYIGLQQGDPNDPQPRLDEDGNENPDHGAHPILSNKQVRQALVYATDRTSIINKVLMGQAAPLQSHIIPTYGWAYNDQLEPRNYDPEKAAQMLEDAGWVLNEETGFRECQGCETAEDGTPMKLNVKTNAGNESREQIMAIVQQQWGDVGIEVDIEAMEWNAYLDVLLGQSFDAVIIGWTGVDPDNEVLFFDKYDQPGGGFNFTSFYRPDYQPLELEAKTVEGCAYEDRGAIYKEIQEIFYDEQPYIWLYAPRSITGINGRIGGVNPAPWSTFYNIEEWYIKSE
jgi:peptide/nickel transport system substrate-binding protein